MKKKNLSGVTTALITPFDRRGEIDWNSLDRLLKDQVKRGVNGFVVNGTTAESPALKSQEVEQILRFVKARIPVDRHLILGVGSNSTQATIENLNWDKDNLADAYLVVVPYYNKPPQRGLVAHFQKIADASRKPIILYNVPGRTITALSLDSISQLASHQQIVGIKEAGGDIEFAKAIRERCGADFLLLSGDDETYWQFMEQAGGDGTISVASHVIPEKLLHKPESSHQYPLELIKALFQEANPIPVKMALYMIGIISSPCCRLPLVELEESRVVDFRNLLRRFDFEVS